MKITLVAMGMGGGETLTLKAQAAIQSADALLGATRLLESLTLLPGQQTIGAIAAAEIARHLGENPQWNQVCILYSGDVGFYSGAAGLYPFLESYEVETVCGVSTVQYFAALLRRPWQGFHLVSAHGGPCDIAAHVINHREVFFLTGAGASAAEICCTLCEAGLGDTQVWVGENLSYPHEEIIHGTARELSGQAFASLSVVLAEGEPAFYRAAVTTGIEDEAFIRGKTPMTKREVRAAALSRLEIRPEDTLYDIGAGTGSVAVEMALLARWGRVYAMEQNAEACQLIRQNKARFGTPNLHILEGRAEALVEELPSPDAVFIGGSGGELLEILKKLLAKNPAVRVVITAVTLETFTQASQALKSLGFRNPEVCQLSVSRSEPLGSYTMLKAQNPVFILSAGGRAND
ncbi:precorrin-6y C5,15-methyltransferase (decarboxylating) subunit CbiE [Oscillospiraceae bacterium MB08-C2-2]|nr:precorrin-6y C5,15-methyltransferase (decarboxylating) subunit CbiE [Oscillospiraceae bacterium MB08-C2-2]